MGNDLVLPQSIQLWVFNIQNIGICASTYIRHATANMVPLPE